MAVIVVGVDASPGSAAALRWALEEASLRAAALVAVHAYVRPLAYSGPDSGVADFDPVTYRRAAELLEEAVRRATGDDRTIDVEQRLRPGNAARALIEAAASADLLVVGARGAGGFEGLLLGSTAEHCARHAPCPVVVVPEQADWGSRRIVVGVDGSSAADSALRWAVDEAARRDAAVKVITAYERVRDDELRQAAEAVAARAVAEVTAPPGVNVTHEATPGHPAHALAEQAATADLLVVGSRGRGGFTALLLGSVTRQLLHHAACPVVVVRA